MKEKILLIGKNGFLGSVLAGHSSDSFEIIGLGHEDLDITDSLQVTKTFKDIKPAVIINTVAMAKTEGCEKKSEEALRINALGALNVARASKEIGAKIVYISTDYVFDGKKEKYSEADVANPINAYGISKYAGELYTLAYNPESYIIRTSCLYGVSPNQKIDFPSLMIKLAKEGKDIEVVDDIFMSPTNISSLSLKIFELLEKKAHYGIYHLAGSGSCSWYELAKKTFEIMEIEYPIKKVSAKDQKVLTNRPKHIELISNRLELQNIERMPSWERDLDKYLKHKFLK